jgi:hypothetical protein
MALRPLPRDTVLGLYVPSGERPLGIAPRSAIVGILRGEDDDYCVEAHYEGAVYGQSMSFEDKIQIAAGRLIDGAPTTAFGVYRADDLEEVGRIARSERMRGWVVTEIDDRVALEAWAGEAVAVDGSEEMRRRAAGIAWGKLSPSRQAEIRMRAQAGGGDIADLVLAAI